MEGRRPQSDKSTLQLTGPRGGRFVLTPTVKHIHTLAHRNLRAVAEVRLQSYRLPDAGQAPAGCCAAAGQHRDIIGT